MVLNGLDQLLSLGELLDAIRIRFGGYDLLAHWTQGEFHHDLVVRLPTGDVLVVATNCNGGVKELIRFASAPERGALWHFRCPGSPEFAGQLPPVLERVTTPHHFDPCELLRDDARSELRPEFRRRQPGGGWEMIPACERR